MTNHIKSFPSPIVNNISITFCPNKLYTILGIMRDEGGQRELSQCLAFRGNKLTAFQPLVAITKDWEEWFIKEKNIEICDIYKPNVKNLFVIEMGSWVAKKIWLEQWDKIEILWIE